MLVLYQMMSEIEEETYPTRQCSFGSSSYSCAEAREYEHRSPSRWTGEHPVAQTDVTAVDPPYLHEGAGPELQIGARGQARSCEYRTLPYAEDSVL